MKILQEIKVPQESVNDQYLTVVGLLFKNGDKVKKDDVLLELETSKAVITIESLEEGYIEYLCNIDDEVGINTIIANIWDEKVNQVEDIIDILKDIKGKDFINPPVISVQNKFQGEYETIFSLKALQLIKDNGLSQELFKDLDFVNDIAVLKYLNPNDFNQSKLGQETKAKKETVVSNHFINDADKFTIAKISHSKKREIEYLSEVQSSGLVSVINIDVDVDYFFNSINDSLRYFKNSLLPFVIYECSRLLLKYPVLNSFYTNNAVAYYNNVNIGIAMDMEDGLKVVKLANTNKLQLIELEEKLFLLANKYLDKKLETEDLIDITFTITDLSTFGAYSFSPLINKNNAAILGISKLDEKLKRVILSLAFDHRVTEGKTATIFLEELKSRIESYANNKILKNSIDHIYCSKCLKTIADDFNDIGFIKIINKRGEEKFICDSCLLNY
jgi:pyruvate/2-oxoglutarate dehydrogenase complex dihydrolipoamide acyltransferase (E2) component